jgi:hypothetical protein
MGWRLSKRLAPVVPPAAALLRPLERTGVRLTYGLHDRLLENPRSRRLFDHHPPVLDAVQQRIVGQLTADGIAVLPFRELVGDPGLWPRLAADAAAFVASATATLDGGADRGHLRKKHLVRRHPLGVELSLDEPWLGLGISTRILDVVNSYLRMYAKCLYVDQWYTAPGGPESERVASQRWHRDFTDKHLVKVFIYLNDVSDEGGPFEYIPGSVPGGRYGALWPWRPLGDTYPPEDSLFKAIPATAPVTCTGSAGTVIFCNTSGFHRGGYATGRPRAMAVYNYASPASLASLSKRNFKVPGADLRQTLPAAARFALD